MATVLSPPEERVVLRDVSWATYERLLTEQQERTVPRFTYDRGVLEIMSPSSEHEEISQLINQLFFLIAGAKGYDARCFSTTTFKREDIQRGFETDSCFYLQSVSRIRGVKKLDLAIHPPPDLIIEVDITSPSIDKFPIYAQVGVPEIWRYKDEKLSIYLRQDEDSYIEVEKSLCLQVTSTALTALLREREDRTLADWQQLVRETAEL
jgi:Uma2 family endonuclease